MSFFGLFEEKSETNVFLDIQENIMAISGEANSAQYFWGEDSRQPQHDHHAARARRDERRGRARDDPAGRQDRLGPRAPGPARVRGRGCGRVNAVQILSDNRVRFFLNKIFVLNDPCLWFFFMSCQKFPETNFS